MTEGDINNTDPEDRVKAMEEIEKLVEEEDYGDRERTDYILSYVQDEFGDDKVIPQGDGVTFRERRGLARDKGDSRQLSEKILSKCEHVKRVLIISANDTGDDGAGILFERSGDGVEMVEQWHGYQGAVGEDVRGYFQEEHRIRGTAIGAF